MTAVYNADTEVLTISSENMLPGLEHLIMVFRGPVGNNDIVYIFPHITPTIDSFIISTTLFTLGLQPDDDFTIRVEIVAPPASTPWTREYFDWSFTLPVITTTSLPDGTVGVPYSQALAATYDGNSIPMLWSPVPVTALPPGLSLNPTTGVISGMPTQAGTFDFDIRFGNSAAYDVRQFSITIESAASGLGPWLVTFDTVSGTRVGGGQLSQTVANNANATPPTLTRTGYTFTGWTPVDGYINVTSNRTLTATWAPVTLGPWTVTFELDGGSRTGGGQLNQTVAHNGNAVLPIVTRANHNFAGWTPADGYINVTSNRTLTATWTPVTTPPGGGTGGGGWGTPVSRPPTQRPPVTPTPPADAERELHRLFMIGDDMGNFRPAAPITRAEAATVLARVNLLNFETGINFLPPGMSSFDTFADVNSSNWFYYYVAWAYSAGLIQGEVGADGVRNFRPNDPITRQEFAALLARTADSILTGNAPFADADAIAGWARNYVFTTYTLGWMIGDEANNFNPSANINRAEVATAISRLLGRIADHTTFTAATIANINQAIVFPDVSASAWFYPSILSATNDHYLTRGANGVVDWKEFVPAR